MASTRSTNIFSPELRSPVSLNSSSGEEVRLSANNPKRPAGRKKFTERRHPVYRGIRSKMSSSKWVCEIREPVRQARIWLGTFPTAEMAARAYDVAAISLRGKSACVNFADSVSKMRNPDSTDPKVIQKAAAEGAKAFRSPEYEIHAPVGDEFNNEKAEKCGSPSSFTYGAMNNETGESASPFWSAFEDGFFDMECMGYGYPGLLPNCFVFDEPEVYTDTSLWNY